MSLRELIVERTRTRGSLTFAEYMELALYHPELGYYTGAAQQSGRAGDFFTSVQSGFNLRQGITFPTAEADYPLHITVSSSILPAGTPALWRRLSTFWVIIQSNLPRLSSSAIA